MLHPTRSRQNPSLVLVLLTGVCGVDKKTVELIVCVSEATSVTHTLPVTLLFSKGQNVSVVN